MKRLITLILFIAASSVLQAQSIFIDRLEPNGLRQIMATGTNVDIGGGQYSLTLKAYTGGGEVFWGLVVSSELFISEATELLMKLDNNEIIHLHADKVSVSTTSKPSHFTTYSYGGISKTYVHPQEDKDYYMTIFNLDDKQVALLEKHAIKKVRISIGQSYLEKASGLKTLSRSLSKSATMIRDQMQKPMMSPKSITDGF